MGLQDAIRNEEAQHQLETRQHVMSEIKRYVEGNNGKYDAFGLMDDMMERAGKTTKMDTQTRMNDVMNELTNNHEYWSKYGESYEGKYAEQQKQKNAEAFREAPAPQEIKGPGYRLQQPSHDIISGKKELNPSSYGGNIAKFADDHNERGQQLDNMSLDGNVLQ